MSNLLEIIIQAGGKGTRLDGLTKNKPKALVPYNNLPLIFHLFRKFKDAHFSIIADYKIEVLQKYLAIFAKDVRYKIIRAKQKGTISGIKEAIRHFGDNESFMIVWCDLVLGKEFLLPKNLVYNNSLAIDTNPTNAQHLNDNPPPLIHCGARI